MPSRPLSVIRVYLLLTSSASGVVRIRPPCPTQVFFVSSGRHAEDPRLAEWTLQESSRLAGLRLPGSPSNYLALILMLLGLTSSALGKVRVRMPLV